jgi:hypothetical protein
MRDTPIPWIGLAAMLAMFILPFVPDWLFQGRRTTKHWPRRHICGDCGTPWTDGHTCTPDASAACYPPLHGGLRRAKHPDLSPQALTGRKEPSLVPRPDETNA